MNSRERVLTAFNHEDTDRLPMYNFLTPEVLKKIGEKTNTTGYDAEIATGNEWLLEWIGVASSFYLKDLDEYKDDWGITWRRVKHDGGAYTEMISHPLSDIGKYDSYKFPAPCDEKRYKNMQDLLKKYKKDYVIVGGIACTLHENAWYLRGLENWLVDLIKNKDFTNDLLDKLTNFYLKCGERLVEMGVDVIWTGDEFGM